MEFCQSEKVGTLRPKIALARESFNKMSLFSSVKTPGGRLVYHYLKKQGTIAKCGDCKKPLAGVSQKLTLLKINTCISV